MSDQRSCRRVAGALLLGVALVVLLTGAAGQAPKQKTVTVCRPVEREVTDSMDFTGRVVAAESVELRARVTGYLMKINFKAGDNVTKGDLLFEIDPRVYVAALEQAKAKLALADAKLQLAERELRRAQQLLPTKAISQADYDLHVQAVKQAEAEIQLAKINVLNAQLNLDFTKIHAPIDGKIGRPALTPGNLVTADKTSLATIVANGPMYAVFNMDERTYLLYRRQLLANKMQQDRVPVYLALADEKGFPHRGQVDFVNNAVDPATGTLQVRASFPNPKGILLPGMFVRVRMSVGQPHKALLVPEKAVRRENRQISVLVVKNNLLHRQFVTIGGLEEGNLRVIETGLRPDDLVVISDAPGFQPGDRVTPKEEPAPPP
jgi:multidrug efflux system membrane fusion protein